jgi:hypothetical protein
MLTSSNYGIYTPKKNFTSTLNKKPENRQVINPFEK